MNKKIAIYCRVSTDDQAENGYNLREQERRIEQYIKAYSEEFTEEVVKYIDDGYSAKDLKRREMLVLLQDIKDGKICKIVIHNLDRLTRSMKDLLYLIELLEEFDVQLFSLREKIDTKTAIGRFFVSMIILIAQWEREAISERTKRAMDQAALEGNYIHGRKPFGYDVVDKKLIVNKGHAAVVKKIFNYYLYEGISMNKIAHRINNEHRDLGVLWTHDRISNMLKTIIYTGTYKNDRIEIFEHSPKIIDSDTFNEVQIKLKYINRVDKHKYLFIGKIYDSKKGEPLTVKPTIKSTKTYLYYTDNNGTYINEQVIVEQIGKYMNKNIENCALRLVQSKIGSLNRKDRLIKEVEDLYDNGLITSNYYYDAIIKLDKKVEINENEISGITSNLNKWETMSHSEKTMYVIKNVSRILVDTNNKEIIKVEFK